MLASRSVPGVLHGQRVGHPSGRQRTGVSRQSGGEAGHIELGRPDEDRLSRGMGLDGVVQHRIDGLLGSILGRCSLLRPATRCRQAIGHSGGHCRAARGVLASITELVVSAVDAPAVCHSSGVAVLAQCAVGVPRVSSGPAFADKMSPNCGRLPSAARCCRSQTRKSRPRFESISTNSAFGITLEP